MAISATYEDDGEMNLPFPVPGGASLRVVNADPECDTPPSADCAHSIDVPFPADSNFSRDSELSTDTHPSSGPPLSGDSPFSTDFLAPVNYSALPDRSRGTPHASGSTEELTAARTSSENGEWCVPGESFIQDNLDLSHVTELETAITGLCVDLDAALPVNGVADLSDVELVGATRAIETLARKLAALQTVSASEVHRRSDGPSKESLAGKLGCRNSTELMQRLTLVPARVIKQRVRLGDTVQPRFGFSGETLPPLYATVADAVSAGRLSIESGLMITDTLKRAPWDADPEFVEAAERSLVEAATGISLTNPSPPEDTDESDTSRETLLAEHADNLRVMCQAWGQALDQDGKLSDSEMLGRRGLRLGRERNGLIPISGALLSTTAALLQEALDAVSSPRTNTNSTDPFATQPGTAKATERENTHDSLSAGSRVRFVATEPDHDNLSEVVDQRTPDQKRHDAFTMLINVAAKHDDIPIAGGSPAMVLLQVTEDTLESSTDLGLGRESGHGWVHGPEGTPIPVPLAAIRHAACSGGLQRVMQDARGRIIELSSPQRVFTTHQRKAITLRDGGCVIPGCMVPARWCEIHHVTEHSKGGRTHTDNGALMCFYHHRTLETSGWAVRMTGGVPEVQAPGWLDPDRLWRRGRSRVTPLETTSSESSKTNRLAFE